MPPASTSDLLQSFQRSQSEIPNIGDSVAQGFDFAQKSMGLELKQQQLEQRKKEAETVKSQQSIRTGDAILDRMNRMRDTPNKGARKVIAGQIAGLTASSGFEMDPATLSEMEGDDDNFKAVTNKINALLEQAPEHIKDVMRASLTETMATQPLSTTMTKLGEFEKLIVAEPARAAAEKIKERETKAKEATAGLAGSKFAFEKKKFGEEQDLKKDELKQKIAEATDKKEQVRQKKTLDQRIEVEKLKPILAYEEIRTGARIALDAIEARTPLQDKAALFALVKVMDPGSVVRESESGLITGAGPLGEKLLQKFSEVVEGSSFNENRRAEFKEIVKSNLLSRMEAASALINRRVKTNDKFGLVREDWDPTLEIFKKDKKLIDGLGGIPGKKFPAVTKNAKALGISDRPAGTRKPEKERKLTPKARAMFDRLSAKVASGTASKREKNAHDKIKQLQGGG
jgi:hypothetical protein